MSPKSDHGVDVYIGFIQPGKTLRSRLYHLKFDTPYQSHIFLSYILPHPVRDSKHLVFTLPLGRSL